MAWIDRDHWGVVERVDDEQIVTCFVRVIVPVWPTRSFYVHGEHATEIRPHTISIAAGLLRTSSWLAAFILALPVVLLPARWLWLATPSVRQRYRSSSPGGRTLPRAALYQAVKNPIKDLRGFAGDVALSGPKG